MADFIIEGGKELAGELLVAGAKNLALKAIAAALLSPQTMKLANVPEIEDVNRQLEILTTIGAKVSRQTKGSYEINTSKVTSGTLPRDLVNKLRASTVLTGPLLARFGEVELSHPGGCKIGRRPIDLFLRGFEILGAEINEIPGKAYQLRAKRLHGGRIVFPKNTVTGTETMMLAAVLADGKTELVNSALEPEIVELANYLNRNGAKISGAGSPTIFIEGVKELNAGEFTMMPDRIEAGTFIMLALATGSSILVNNCDPKHLEVPIAIWQDMGANLKINDNSVEVAKSKKLRAVDIKTHEYPGFVTDLQSSMTVLLTQAAGHSLVHETIFEGRLFFADVLNQMGAEITLCDPHRIIIQGPTALEGRTIETPDARAGLALLTASLAARGTSIIKNVYPIDRGYELLEERLNSIGASVKRV